MISLKYPLQTSDQNAVIPDVQESLLKFSDKSREQLTEEILRLQKRELKTPSSPWKLRKKPKLHLTGGAAVSFQT